MKLLVTGGAGYIGSHTCVELMHAGHEIVIVDNLSNSKKSVLDRIELIMASAPDFIEADLRDKAAMADIFDQHEFDGVLHFSGLKAIGESVAEPLKYYDNNVNGSLVLFETMSQHGVFNIVFSSSATVYGDPATVPIDETFPLHATNPYGRTKLIIEDILGDLHASDERWNIALLRYFNPVGAHSSGLIGEDPNGIPNNLMPYIAQVAIKKLSQVNVFGDDYDTADGTGVRDYIHVVDLAIGHLRALEKLQENPGVVKYNLGTGKGLSVLELISAFAKASGVEIPYRIAPRRAGDIAKCYADPTLAGKELGWTARLDVHEMCKDVWRWQTSCGRA